ncbi:HNH endonuclease [Aldersonia sp. NBC_00410]|uniref:HNH endonuclease signature motif containing protein n=1 Tax=Aldersonia sp. NBC_00410 TaxID=2975954 RepID=UPI00224E4A98|nr:HNH endonuclease signature motif containing protein [Aldersonia sp. NBC_00410]MCX5045210.1 HNH endonuclease [Aldersonia sp. NBC_00410]
MERPAVEAKSLLEQDLTTMSDAVVVDVLRELEELRRRLEALSNRMIVEVVERSIPAARGHRSPKRFLVEVLRISSADASARITAAQDLGVWHAPSGAELPVTLPQTAVAQRDGAIGADHVRAVRAAMRKIPAAVSKDDRRAAEAILVELSRTSTPEAVQSAGERLLAHLDPDGTVSDEPDRVRRRGVTVGRQDNALMSRLAGELDPIARAMLDTILAKWARPGMNNPDDPESPCGAGEGVDRDVLAAAAGRDQRSTAQRNHDALTAVFRTVLESGVLGKQRGLPAIVIVTMAIDQLEQAAGGVATTATGGVLPISDALRLAERAHPFLVVFGNDGRPLHLGRAHRLASSDQRLALIAADRGCTRPGCDAPASLCAVHHVRGWNKGGSTDIENLALACDSCHALVNEGPLGWATRTTASGRTGWIGPVATDPDQRVGINTRHHPDELLRDARRRIDYERESGVA